MTLGSEICEFAFTEAGKGNKILWLHGYTLDSTIWQEIWAYLPGFGHIAIDLPGHGQSAPMEAGEDLVKLARRIGQFALDREIRHVVGLSFGATVALQIAIQFPQSFETYVLASPGLGGGPTDRAAQSRNLEIERLFQVRGFGRWIADLWVQSPPDIFTGAQRNRDLWESLFAVIESHKWLELESTTMRGMMNLVQPTHAIGRIESRMLLLVGDSDIPAFKRSAEIILRAARWATRVYVGDCGHLTLLEDPKSCARLIRAHLTKGCPDL